jgi:hydrogenase maturation protease
VCGCIRIAAQRVAEQTWRVSIRIENESPITAAELSPRDVAQRRALVSTHTILGLEDGVFVSLMDPPSELREAVSACQNIGTWPVLAGPEGQRRMMLSSPIILYDYPQIAPESPGNLFDSTEIDEILSLRILTLTDEEKREMAGASEQARALLERTESLTPADWGRLHGALRRPQPEPIGLKPGDRVRLRPRRRADIMDVVLKDKVAIIESIERDFEDRIHVAVTVLDDPGREFGLDRMPGHRFFFAQDEVELLRPETLS